MRQPFGAQLVAGDLWSWNITVEGYSASDGYTLKYYFRGPSVLDLASQVGADGRSFQIDSPSADTTKLTPGAYAWQCVIVDSNNNRLTLARGGIDVMPNLESRQAGVESRSWARRSLDHVEAVIENRAGRIDLEYSVAGRMLKTLSPSELLEMRANLQNIVQRELRDAGQLGRNAGDIKARFCRE